MRKIWLAGAAALAFTMIGSAGAPQRQDVQDLFAALCRENTGHAGAWLGRGPRTAGHAPDPHQ